ncbi:ATP-dependent protease subunit HslV [Pasteuria penetrans]|uniref:ATP-dependent protease subunit HslV n=1 Tax=Pasteuria penetrans TaxID=86005 RepID=UPI000FA618DD|nr:ATP-dependent protease subunit HslV [Pasteuria penetrans]
MRGTTICAVRHKGRGAMAGDGQVTFSEQLILKHQANKVRRLHKNRVVAGFAGSVADAFTLFETFEVQLEQHQGHLLRSAVHLAKKWRSDRALRRLEAMLIAMDSEDMLLVSGGGEVIKPDDDVLAIGSGGGYAMVAARALKRYAGQLEASVMAKEALLLASSICVYTNDSIVVEEVDNGNKGTIER